MTAANGRKRRPAASSPRQAATKGAPRALPDTRLPLRALPNGTWIRSVDYTSGERLSERSWAKGSARGAGPQQQRGGVAVAAVEPWVPCGDCGSLRPAHAAGRHGALPPTAAALARPGWPTCPHGRPHWENCRVRPVPPPCCLGGGR